MINQDPHAQEAFWTCARPADLRTRLKALVREWQESPVSRPYAHALAALLAESEPEEPQDNAHQLAERLVAQAMHGAKVPPGYTQQRPGCGRDHGGGSWNANCPDCEAKAKLPLGHEYEGYPDGSWCGVQVGNAPNEPLRCGQPRSAHELDKGEGGTP